MYKSHLLVTTVLSLLACVPQTCFAQYGGNSVGANQHNANGKPAYDVATKNIRDPRFISIDGSAEIRVKPTEVRMVLAVVAEKETASECQAAAAEMVKTVIADWKSIGISEEDIFEDFIGILPVYEFEEQNKEKYTVMQEVLKRHRLQINLHLRLSGNDQAKQALEVAFKNNISDIIAFDYWSSELESVKTAALQKAIAAAKAKSKIVLDEDLFPNRPKVVNFTENSSVIFPKQMYETYSNTIEQTVTTPYNWKRNIPSIRAARARTSYYTGPKINGDSLSPKLPMKPEISVVCKVRLVFESPFEPKTKENK